MLWLQSVHHVVSSFHLVGLSVSEAQLKGHGSEVISSPWGGTQGPWLCVMAKLLLFCLVWLLSFASAFSHFSDEGYSLAKVFLQTRGRWRTWGRGICPGKVSQVPAALHWHMYSGRCPSLNIVRNTSNPAPWSVYHRYSRAEYRINGGHTIAPSVWILSLGSMHGRFIRVLTWVDVSFLSIAELYSIVCVWEGK